MTRNISQGAVKKDRQSRDGRKPTTKGGKGGKVQMDGTDHRAMGYLTEDYAPMALNSKDPNFCPDDK